MPDKIGHYVIVSELGRGGMGVVYKGREESLDRFVAIKVLGEHLTSEPEFLTRFIREARAAASLSHPNIIQIYFIGEDAGRHYFVMEYVAGRSVQSMINREGRVGNPKAAQIILQAAHGLAAAHDQGIYHRDIKPGNLMLDERGVLKIADFGLALPVEAQTRLTAAGKIMGTPGYLSPEHCLGQSVDHRADIYALGITYYEMLTGVMPFRGESPIALLRSILQDDPPDIQQLNPDVDEETRRILMKMLMKNRDERYQDCHQLVADLEEYLANRGVRSPTAGLATRISGKASRDIAAEVPTALVDVPTSAPTQRLSAAPAFATEKPFTMNNAPTTPSITAVVPVAPAAVPAPVAVAVPRRSSRTAAFVAIAAVVFLLLVGGAVASYFGYRYFTRGSTTPQTASAASTTPIPTQPQPAKPGPEALLSAAAAIPTATTGQSGQSVPPQNLTATINAPASAQAPPQATTEVIATRKAPVAADSHVQAPPAARRLSGVAFAAAGDAGLNHAVAGVLSAEMAELKAVNAEDLPEMEGVIGDGDVSPGAVIDRLRRAGIAVLVLARIKPTGQRALEYMGRSDTAYGSNVTLVTYDVASGRPIGERASATIEYTQLTAQREAEKMVGPLARRAAEAIQTR